MSKTIQTFKNEIQSAPKLKEKIVLNISSQKENKIVTNLFSLEYDFKNKNVALYCYVNDREHPDEVVSFCDFVDLVREE